AAIKAAGKLRRRVARTIEHIVDEAKLARRRPVDGFPRQAIGGLHQLGGLGFRIGMCKQKLAAIELDALHVADVVARAVILPGLPVRVRAISPFSPTMTNTPSPKATRLGPGFLVSCPAIFVTVVAPVCGSKATTGP